MSAAEAKAAVVPESVLRKRKREEQWAAGKKEKALAHRKKALESRKIIFARAKQYAQEYDAQVSTISVVRPLWISQFLGRCSVCTSDLANVFCLV